MKKKLSLLIIILGLSITSINAQTYFPLRNIETNLGPFSNINGQWIAVTPTNNTLGSNYYQGINFGFDTNNYASLVNAIGTDEIYFGRWSFGWNDWNKIWHSGNLNNIKSDFTARTIKTSKINFTNTTYYYNPSSLTKTSYIEFQNADSDKISYIFGAIPPEYHTPGIGIATKSAWDSPEIYNLFCHPNGNVGISTTKPDEKLTVNGKIHAKEIKIDLDFPAPDYVFTNDYKLKSLQEVEEFIKQNSHLPEIPSAKEIEKNGLMLAEMNMSLLKKIEELTLYSIEQNKNNLDLKQKVEKLEKENEGFKSLSERLSKIENQLK
ncbi:THO complex subunit 5 [Flavobacterium hydatis]|uniref:Cell wall anchor protein n=1 Tax=Flavobacterium hydatis TaxID=991 RepID=A0ABX4CGB7_FLAHY|nr:hypothetical protein [Flavobacterium hydatis]OXA93650.1 hypothetical protein B0A62_12935 [Flavobacterium hydatis]